MDCGHRKPISELQMVNQQTRSTICQRSRRTLVREANENAFCAMLNILRTVSCSIDNDVRCSVGIATMLTSDVLHGHARRQRQRVQSLHHLAPYFYQRLHKMEGCQSSARTRLTAECKSYGSAIPAHPARLDKDAFIMHKATNHKEAEHLMASAGKFCARH